MGAGRPSSFTQETVDEICERLSEGESLKSICRDERMPSYSTVREWELKGPAFCPEFPALSTRAKEIGCHALADGCLEIADDGSNDWMKSNKPDDEGYALNGEHIQRSKLRIETRMRLLGKWLPKVYGDKATVELGNKPGETFRSDVQVSPEEAYKKMLDGV